jgi:hypothetical protein
MSTEREAAGMRGRGFLVLLLLSAVGASSGCELTTSTDRAEEIRIQVTSESTEPVEIITSNFFVVVETEEGDVVLDFLVSDTILVHLPHDQTYPLAPTFNFAVRVQAPLEDDTRVTFRASTGGTERFRREGYLLDLDRPLDFFYSAN